MHNFHSLGLSDDVQETVRRKGFEEPTEIQARTIPILLHSDKDIIAQAQTGTGKTAAFGLVFVEKLVAGVGYPQALVLVPTRELAIQVAEEINSLRGEKQLRIVPIYGGQSYTLQLRQLQRGVDIIISTPGRLLDHLRSNRIDLSKLKYTVLDEADEMLNMGFMEDLEAILAYTNPERQMLLFSATMPPRIKALAGKFMREQEHIKAKGADLAGALVDQVYNVVAERDKFEALCRIIDLEPDFYGIIFCRTRVDVDQVSRHLEDRGYRVSAIHGEVVQKQREKLLESFRRRNTMILVATDVAARGIDVENVSHVINYCLPHDPESYVHRIGRTGRAGNSGKAVTFVTPAEMHRLTYIGKIANAEIRRERIPNAEQILAVKRDRMREALDALAESASSREDLESFIGLAGELLQRPDRLEAVAALIKKSYGTELEQDISRDNRDINVEPQRPRPRHERNAGNKPGQKNRRFNRFQSFQQGKGQKGGRKPGSQGRPRPKNK